MTLALAPSEIDDATLAAFVDTLGPEEVELLAGSRTLDQPAPTLRKHLEQTSPGTWLDAYHIGELIEVCQAFLDREIQNLALCAPPRTGKSRVVAQGLPAAAVRRDQRSKIIVTCASDDLVKYHSRHTRDQVLAAKIGLRGDSKSVTLWETAAGGTYRAVTFLGGNLGFGGDVIVVDDPFASMEAARSRTLQQRVFDRWKDDVQSRLQSAPDGSPAQQVLMHQRLCDRDLWARVMELIGVSGSTSWHAFILRAYAEARAYVLPPTVTLIPDKRQPGEPLCDDPGIMAPIAERRMNDPHLHRIIDEQDPPRDAGGGLFRASWLPIIGTGRSDLDSPLKALDAMAREGLVSPVKSLHRGHDCSGGGADPVASCGLARLMPGAAVDLILFDPTEDHPPGAAVIPKVLDNAQRGEDRAVRQAIPKEAAVGKAVSDTIAASLRSLDYVVDLYPIGRGKRALAQPLAGAAAPLCRKCGKVQGEDGAESGDACGCTAPDIRPGRVAILAGPMAERLRDQLHDFTGEDGGRDDMVDSAAIAYNASDAVQEKRGGRIELPGILLG